MNTEIKEIDFNYNYGEVAGLYICKDCKNGENIVSKVSIDVSGYARIWIYCNIHGEWEPTGALTSQCGLPKEIFEDEGDA